MSNSKSKDKKEKFWELHIRMDGRVEYDCTHGVGHGMHPHGCDGCCSRKDYPLAGKKPEDIYNSKTKRGKELINMTNACNKPFKSPSPLVAKPCCPAQKIEPCREIRSARIACLFKGCDGTVDLIEEMRELVEGSRKNSNGTYEIPWVIHTIICPKCYNAIGDFDIRADAWVTPKGLSINTPYNNSYAIVTDSKNSLNPHLKDWARWEFNSKKRRQKEKVRK